MKEKNNTKGSGGPISFVKGVKDKIMGTIFHESPKEEVIEQLERAKAEIVALETAKEGFQSKWLLMTRRFHDAGSITLELKKIDDEIKGLTEKISLREERIRALYASKDDHIKDLEQARANLKKLLEEKRTIHDDVSILKKYKAEVAEVKKELAQARSREDDAIKALEDVGIKLKFASANMETLVLDSAVAKKALDDLESVVETKKESIKSEEKARSGIEQVLEGLDELKNAKDRVGYISVASKKDFDRLKEIRKAIKDAEGEHSVIPKRIAELNVMGANAKERTELIQKERSLTGEIERLKADEKKMAREAENSRSALEEVEAATLKLKRLLVSASFNDYVSRVDSASPDTLKRDIEKKRVKLVNAIDAHRKELAQAQNEQSQKRVIITRMRDELNKLTKGAGRDKREVELQREKLKKIKDQTSVLRIDLEAKLREKTSGASQGVSVNMEMKRIEGREADAVGSINRIEADINSTEHAADEMLSALRKEKEHFEELAEMERFFRGKLETVKELERLRSAEREMIFSQQLAAKYEADLRKIKGVEKQKKLLEVKLVLVDEPLVPIPVIELRLLEMRKEDLRLNEELAPLRSELDFAFEKRDNAEMEASFAREALKKCRERKVSLERKLEFITKESGSIKNIQEKVAVCENRLATAKKNITEIQIRLNFATATEDVVSEKFQDSQETVKQIDQEISSLNDQIEVKVVLLPDLRQKLLGYESQLDNEQGARIGAETNQSMLATELKKTAIECDALTEKIINLDVSYEEYKEKERTIEDIEPSYKANLEKHKEFDIEIAGLSKEIDDQKPQIDDIKAQVAELQVKKRQLMEKSLESLGVDESAREASKDQGKRDALREGRKVLRAKIKDIEANIKELDKALAGKTDAEKKTVREAIDSLRSERDDLHKKIDNIKEELTAIKEGAGEVKVESAPKKGEAEKLARAIGEADIKLLTSAKNLDRLEPELEAKRDELKKLTATRDALELEIEDQKNIISALDEVKTKIESLEKEKDSAQRSLEGKMNQKDLLTNKAQEADNKVKTRLKNIEEAQKGSNKMNIDVDALEVAIADLRNKHTGLIRDKERIFAEYNRLKDEMDSIVNSTARDREMVEKEKITAEGAHREVEDTKKQLAEAMSILTGKTGSIDSLRLEVSSSAEEEKDTSDRISNLEIELKSSLAAIKGIEFNMEPKTQRLKYIVWAQGLIDGRLEDLKLRTNLEKTNKKLRELEESRDLIDEYKDLTMTKKELRKHVGGLRSHLELETRMVTAEQARHEAMAQASENADRLESQEALTMSLEEKYKSSQEEKLEIKGKLDEVTRQFGSAKAMWGKIEDLSRVKDSVEFKIRQFNDKFGAMEKISARVERMEKEREGFIKRINNLEAKCRDLEEEKEFLEGSLIKSMADFESSFELVKKSRDEARKFLSSAI